MKKAGHEMSGLCSSNILLCLRGLLPGVNQAGVVGRIKLLFGGWLTVILILNAQAPLPAVAVADGHFDATVVHDAIFREVVQARDECERVIHFENVLVLIPMLEAEIECR